jgi:hypothetical protein
MQCIDEVRVPYARRPRLLEMIDCVLDAISKPFNEVRDKEEARAVEAIMAMYADQTRPVLASDLVDEIDEHLDLVSLRRLL